MIQTREVWFVVWCSLFSSFQVFLTLQNCGYFCCIEDFWSKIFFEIVENGSKLIFSLKPLSPSVIVYALFLIKPTDEQINKFTFFDNPVCLYRSATFLSKVASCCLSFPTTTPAVFRFYSHGIFSLAE